MTEDKLARFEAGMVHPVYSTFALFVAFFFTGSSAMMAEAVHSLADTSNQIFLFLGIRKSGKQHTALHPFGAGT